MEKAEYYFRIINNPGYKFNDSYNLIYLTRSGFRLVSDSLFALRKMKYIDGSSFHVIYSIFKHYYNNGNKIIELDRQQPRLIAQKFIGKKNIREFIFKRDSYKCLCCGSDDNLQLDHIIPIHYGGENKLSNLQTLCRKCNSSKGIKFKDYR